MTTHNPRTGCTLTPCSHPCTRLQSCLKCHDVTHAHSLGDGMSTTHTYADQGGRWAYAVNLDAMTFSALSDDCDHVLPIWLAGRNVTDYIDARDWQTVDDTLALHDGAIKYAGVVYAY